MKRCFFALLVSFSLLESPAAAAPITFAAFLSGNAEVPPTGSPGTGFGLVTFDPVANILQVEAVFSGLLGTTTAAHIHCCTSPAMPNAGVATQTPSFIGFPLGVTSGTFANVFDTTLASTYRAGFITDSGGTTATAEAVLFAGMLAGNAYLNIHSSLFGGGEIRGNLTPIPEPATLVLLASGLAGAGLRRWRKRHASRS